MLRDLPPEPDVIAAGGRRQPFHVGDAAVKIGGLGEAIMIAGNFMVAAQKNGFAEAVYDTLCNTTWVDRVGKSWGCSWRCAGDIAASIRGWDGDDYLTFYCSGGEGRIDEQVRAMIGKLGWKQVYV